MGKKLPFIGRIPGTVLSAVLTSSYTAFLLGELLAVDITCVCESCPQIEFL